MACCEAALVGSYHFFVSRDSRMLSRIECRGIALHVFYRELSHGQEKYVFSSTK